MSDVTPGYRISVDLIALDGSDVTPQNGGSIPSRTDGDNYASTGITSITGKTAYTSANVASAEMGIVGDDIAWATVRIYAGDAASTTNTAREIVVYVRRATNDQHVNRGIPNLTKEFSGVVTAVPTQGYAPLGYQLFDDTALTKYICTRSVDTTLASPASGGTASIVLTDATGIASGDIVGIQNDDLMITDWRTVNSAAGTPTITLSGGNLTGNCAAGNRVVFLDWTTLADLVV
jgi:hypothetical protein